MNYEWLALAAALLWAVSSLISVTPSRHLGAFAYSRWRMACVTVMLSSMAWFNGGWSTMQWDYASVMMLSGVIGIFIGDTALFCLLQPYRAPSGRSCCLPAMQCFRRCWGYGCSVKP